MWSWLQNLMRIFRGEDQREMEQDHPPTVHRRQFQAKTKSIFPKEREANRTTHIPKVEKERQFRFPVVPDDYQVKPPSQRGKAIDIERQTPGRERPGKDRLASGEERQAVSGEGRQAVKETRFPAEREKTANGSGMTGESGRHYRPAERSGAVRGQIERTIRPAAGTAEKQGYKPSEIVSPVFGKITPSTNEAEHRIHTTAGIVYPRQEQEELIHQRKQWEEQLGQGTNGSSDGRKKTSLMPEIAVEPAFQGIAEEKDAEQMEESMDLQQEARVEQSEILEERLEVKAEHPDGPDERPAACAGGTLTQENLPEADGGQPAVDEALVPGCGNEQAETFLNMQDVPGGGNPLPDPAKEADEVNEADEANDLTETTQPGFDSEGDEELAAELAHPLPEIKRLAEEEAAASWSASAADRDAVSEADPEPEEGMAEPVSAARPAYVLPQLDLLNPSPPPLADDDEHTQLQKLLLEETLSNFHVSAQVIGIVKGPSVTRFELQPAPGVKVNKITSLADDIKLNLAAKDIRIEAPIPGRNAIGIEVPNLKSEPVLIEKIIRSNKFRTHPSPLAVALGMDIGGEPIVADIKKMPHGLIAGATGSGKSVCINSIIVSLLFKATPEQVRLLLIDPKMVELIPYNNLPHLVTPVVTEAKQATAALKWAVEEMEKRYALFVDAGVRDIERYNQTTDDPLPYIVIVIDELADLMMVSPQDVEDSIIRIAQKARACGIHLLLATQRPSVDVITGNIKANVPTRLAFAVFSQVDSRTILDQSGAERLLGRGDMLFLESGTTPVRLQGNFVSDDEIERVTSMIKKQRKPSYLFSKEDLEHQAQSFETGDDPLYLEALVFVAEQGQASASGLQRRFRVGYNRAARLIEMMEADGYVSGQNGGKARSVLITPEDAQALAEGSTLL